MADGSPRPALSRSSRQARPGSDSHRPIVYPLALLTNAQDPADKAFFDAVQSDQAKAVFQEQGFDILH